MASSVILDSGGDFIGKESLFNYTTPSYESFTSQTISVPFSNKDLNFGKLCYAIIPKKDDVVKSLYLKTLLGSLTHSCSSGYIFPFQNADTNIYSPSNLVTPIISLDWNYGFLNTTNFHSWYTGTSVSIVDNNFVFSISGPFLFKSEQAAQFWGFDITLAEGDYIFSTSVGTLNLVQSGWTTALQKSLSPVAYVDSVGDALVQTATMYIGNQTIQSITSMTMQIEDDIQCPLENQAGLTITVGRKDTSTANFARTYWTRLNFEEIPLCTLYDQTVQVGVQFETFANLTTGSLYKYDILDPSAYKYVASYATVSQVTTAVTYNNSIVMSVSGGAGGSPLNGLLLYDASFKFTSKDVAPGTLVVYNNIIYTVSGMNTRHNYLTLYTTELVLLSTSTYDVFSISGTVITYLGTDAGFIYMFTDACVIVYDTTKPLNLSSSYYKTTFDTNTQAFATTYIDGNFYVPKSDLSGLYIMNATGIRSGTGISTINIPIQTPIQLTTDATYIYTGGAEIDSFTQGIFRFHKTTLIIEYVAITGQLFNLLSFPILATFFDGRFVYHITDASGGTQFGFMYYDITKPFTNINSWYWFFVLNDGTTISSDGNAGISSIKYLYKVTLQLVLLNDVVYIMGNDTSGNIQLYSINQTTTITPSIQTQMIVQYSKLENPYTSSVSLVNQNKTNVFTMRAGELSDIFSLTFSGPIRELWIQSNAKIVRLVLELNGQVLVDEDYTSLSVLRPFGSHIITPSQTLYTYSFAIDPNSIHSVGSLNISRIRLATMNIFIDQVYSTDQTITVYSRSVNVLDCENGIGGLLFN
jgi:hypothetical protein